MHGGAILACDAPAGGSGCLRSCLHPELPSVSGFAAAGRDAQGARSLCMGRFSGNVTAFPMVAPPPTPRSFAVDVARVSAAFQDLARQMGAQFLDKQEIIRLMTISAIAG